MVRKLAIVSLFFMGSLVAVAATADLSIKDVMKKVPGKKGLFAKTAEAAKAEKWDDAAKYAKEIQATSDAMIKGKPSKGDAASWKTHSETYKKNVDAIAAAIEKKDGKAFGEAATTFGKSCGACHDAHK